MPPLDRCEPANPFSFVRASQPGFAASIDRPGRKRAARGWLKLGVGLVALWSGSGAVARAQGQPAPKAGGSDPTIVDPMSLLPQPKTAQSQRVPIFFPPNPPPLDMPVAYGIVPPGRLAAPAELGMFVGESFYPALSTRLFASTLYGKVRSDLGEYYAAKAALQKQLRAELSRQREADPAARLRALEALARLQAPKIADVEQMAERLRRTLITVNYSWSILREWHLGDDEKRGFSPVEIAKVMRGYAFYQNGLLPRQRALLREVAMELLAAVDDPAKATLAQPYFFFTPETSRVLLPDNLPPELAARVAAYQAKKSQMKEELYDTIWKYDGGNLDFWRNPIRTLARKHVTGFKELDALAEEIRRGLTQLPASPPAPPQRAALPPVLVDRIQAVLRDRSAAIRRATVKADAVVDRTYEVRVRITYSFDDDGMRFVVVPGLGRTGPITKAEEKFYDRVRSDLGLVADEYGNRLAELINEQEAIRREAGDLLGTRNPNDVDAAIRSITQLAVQEETGEAYRDYRAAVFEPGLSPEQRRLLFDAAIERLDLPLPRGEMQITSRYKTW